MSPSDTDNRSQITYSPVNGEPYVERILARSADLEKVLARAVAVRTKLRELGLERRGALLGRMTDLLVAKKATLAEELTWQMGRPLSQTPVEIDGYEERARKMVEIGWEALQDINLAEVKGAKRFIRRQALGTVLVLAPWNYPWLTAVNVVIPALMAGNSVVLKHSDQTPLVAERMVEAAFEAGFPEHALQFVHMDHDLTAKAVLDPRIDYVTFTGSVEGGRAVQRAAGQRFVHVGLELGGKDGAYVRHDADLAHTAESLVDGAFYNSGQSCCGIERIYVHRDGYDELVERMVALTRDYRLGDPSDMNTTLGPVVRASNAASILKQVDAALSAGAQGLIDPKIFPAVAERGLPYLAPQILVDVDHSMQVMVEETFGPVVGIMAVDSDEQAVALLNDCRYGLTSSIWSQDQELCERLADGIDSGLVYMNRCDFVDPELPWVGVRDSGRACSLSKIGYEHLTRPKSFYLGGPV